MIHTGSRSRLLCRVAGMFMQYGHSLTGWFTVGSAFVVCGEGSVRAPHNDRINERLYSEDIIHQYISLRAIVPHPSHPLWGCKILPVFYPASLSGFSTHTKSPSQADLPLYSEHFVGLQLLLKLLSPPVLHTSLPLTTLTDNPQPIPALRLCGLRAWSLYSRGSPPSAADSWRVRTAGCSAVPPPCIIHEWER